MPYYEGLFGAFIVSEAPLEGVLYRGEEIRCTLKIAVNNDNPIEIELIQVLEGETPHTEHLREHGEGLHHIRFRVSDIEPKIAELKAAGYEKTFWKRFGPSVAFAYLRPPGQHRSALIELLEMP